MAKKMIAVLGAAAFLFLALAGCGASNKNVIDFSAPGSLSSFYFRYQPDPERLFSHNFNIYVLNGEVCLYEQSGQPAQPHLDTPLLIELDAPEKIVDILRRGNAQNWRKEYASRSLFSRNPTRDYILELGFWGEGYDSYSSHGRGGNRPPEFDETSEELLAYLAACAESGRPRPLSADDDFSSIVLETEDGRLEINFLDISDEGASANLYYYPTPPEGAESEYYQYALGAADAPILNRLASMATEGYNQSLESWTPEASPSATIPLEGDFALYVRYQTVSVYLRPKDALGYTVLPFSFVPMDELNRSMYELGLSLIDGKSPAKTYD